MGCVECCGKYAGNLNTFFRSFGILTATGIQVLSPRAPDPVFRSALATTRVRHPYPVFQYTFISLATHLIIDHCLMRCVQVSSFNYTSLYICSISLSCSTFRYLCFIPDIDIVLHSILRLHIASSLLSLP